MSVGPTGAHCGPTMGPHWAVPRWPHTVGPTCAPHFTPVAGPTRQLYKSFFGLKSPLLFGERIRAAVSVKPRRKCPKGFILIVLVKRNYNICTSRDSFRGKVVSRAAAG
ncbi:hypothetical protein GJAV_G00162140 [Gymnothorax javanicus]|nr:hypothetical protein GJAV_G00162140 [Gymnothorax javanicus]